MSRIALLTDQPIVAKGFSAVISTAPDFDLAAICAHPDQLLQTAAACDPDILLADKSEHVTLDWLIQLRRHLPQRCRIVLWVYSIEPEVAYQSMRIGVRGILRKTLGTELLVQCLRSVAAGECWFEEELTSSFLESTTVTLTPRETDLINLISQGCRNKEIAGRLTLSEATVKVYLHRLFRKLGVTDRVELALYAMRNALSDQTALASEQSPGLPVSAMLVLRKPPAPTPQKMHGTASSAVRDLRTLQPAAGAALRDGAASSGDTAADRSGFRLLLNGARAR